MIKPVHNDKSYSINTMRTKQGKKYQVQQYGRTIGTFSRVQSAKRFAINDSRQR